MNIGITRTQANENIAKCNLIIFSECATPLITSNQVTLKPLNAYHLV